MKRAFRLHHILRTTGAVSLLLLAATLQTAQAQTTTVVNFDSPPCPAAAGVAFSGVYGGINWLGNTTGKMWDCESPGVATGETGLAISWAQQVSTGQFSFVNPSILQSFTSGGPNAGTLTVTTDAGESKSVALPGNTMTLVATGFTKIATTVTVTYTDTWNVHLDNVTYVTPVLTSIAVTPAAVSLGVGAKQQYTATGTYAGASPQVLTTATWTSGTPAVASISATGLATVLGASTTPVSITASMKNSAGTLITSAPAMLTATAAVAAACSPVPTAPSPLQTIDMKLLVVNYAASNYADFPAIQQILNYIGMPYDVVEVTTGNLPNGAPPVLSDGACHGYYQGVIYAFGDDIYNNGVLHANLTAYEKTFGVRRLNWYLNPVPDFGLNATTTYLQDTQTDTGTFSAAAAPVFFYANTATPVTITNAFAYLTTPVAAGTVASNGTITSVTPLLTDPQGYALSAITTFSDGRQYLNQMFDSNPYLMHDLVLAYGLINWVTKGVFLGDYHVYAVAQVDDFFINDSEWIPGTPCTDPITHDRTPPDAASLPVFRVNYSTDISRLVTWQNTKQRDLLLTNFELTLAFNGVGTAGNPDWTGLAAGATDTLVSDLSRYQQHFHWISHTYNHPTTLNGLHKSDPGGDLYNVPQTDSIDLEVLTNLWVAKNANGKNLDTDPSDVGLKQLTFTDFNPGNMVTPGITGLNDPNTPTYLYQDGIRYVVTDTSVIGQANNGPNPSPNVGIVNIDTNGNATGIYEVPRHPNDVFYNAANWNDDHAEFNCLYTNPPFAGYTAAQILDFVSSSFVTNMLMGDMDPEMFHQTNLHFSNNASALGLTVTHTSSPLTDTYDQTFSKYEKVYKLPVLSPTLDQLGQLMQNRNAYNLSGVTASLTGVGGASPTITIAVPTTAAIIPVTGTKSAGSESYGGQNISHIQVNAGQTITLPLQ